MTIHQQRVLSNSSMMCGPPREYMVPPYEYEENRAAENDYRQGSFVFELIKTVIFVIRCGTIFGIT